MRGGGGGLFCTHGGVGNVCLLCISTPLPTIPPWPWVTVVRGVCDPTDGDRLGGATEPKVVMKVRARADTAIPGWRWGIGAGRTREESSLNRILSRVPFTAIFFGRIWRAAFRIAKFPTPGDAASREDQPPPPLWPQVREQEFATGSSASADRPAFDARFEVVVGFRDQRVAQTTIGRPPPQGARTATLRPGQGHLPGPRPEAHRRARRSIPSSSLFSSISFFQGNRRAPRGCRPGSRRQEPTPKLLLAPDPLQSSKS